MRNGELGEIIERRLRSSAEKHLWDLGVRLNLRQPILLLQTARQQQLDPKLLPRQEFPDSRILNEMVQRGKRKNLAFGL